MSLMRSMFLALSRSRWLREIAVDFPPARLMSRRFVAGETLEQAVSSVETLNQAGLLASIDYLGENVTSETEARDAVHETLDLLAAIERMGLACQPLEPVLSGSTDPETRAAALGRAFKEAYSEREKLSIAYTEGGHAREGAIILLGETAVDVARKAIAIAETYTTAP